MDPRNPPQQTVTELRLLAAAIELQHITDTTTNIIPIPGGARVIAIGERADVAQAMQAGPRELPAKLRSLGNQMANVMYGLAQKVGQPLESQDCTVMEDLRRQWDEAMRVHRAALAAEAEAKAPTAPALQAQRDDAMGEKGGDA
jgi:hypothetical protein